MKKTLTLLLLAAALTSRADLYLMPLTNPIPRIFTNIYSNLLSLSLTNSGGNTNAIPVGVHTNSFPSPWFLYSVTASNLTQTNYYISSLFVTNNGTVTNIDEGFTNATLTCTNPSPPYYFYDTFGGVSVYTNICGFMKVNTNDPSCTNTNGPFIYGFTAGNQMIYTNACGFFFTNSLVCTTTILGGFSFGQNCFTNTITNTVTTTNLVDTNSFGTYTLDPTTGSLTNLNGYVISLYITNRVVLSGTNIIYLQRYGKATHDPAINSTNYYYPSTIIATNAIPRLYAFRVGLVGFSHDFPADMFFLLSAPNDTSVFLMGGAGDWFSLNTGVNLLFSDLFTKLPSFSGYIDPGYYLPTNYYPDVVLPSPAPQPPIGQTNSRGFNNWGDDLMAFSGVNASMTNGWRLFCWDNELGDGGILTNWIMEFDLMIPLSLTNPPPTNFNWTIFTPGTYPRPPYPPPTNTVVNTNPPPVIVNTPPCPYQFMLTINGVTKQFSLFDSWYQSVRLAMWADGCLYGDPLDLNRSQIKIPCAYVNQMTFYKDGSVELIIHDKVVERRIWTDGSWAPVDSSIQSCFPFYNTPANLPLTF